MKFLLTVLFVLMPILHLDPCHAIDLQEFHDGIYRPIGSACGLHTEVSGRWIIATNILPPNMSDKPNVCSGPYRSCRGKTYRVSCNYDGECWLPSHDRTTDPPDVILLEDGNFLNMPTIMSDGRRTVKFVRTSARSYSWCGPSP